ncbi:MAG: putative 2OG-Fe(II) oxygenase, partial [Pseudomonadota bacterium]
GRTVRALRDLIRAHIDSYLQRPPHAALRAARRMPAYDLNVWVTVLDEGGHQAPHIHPAGVVSGVYYVAVPNPADSAIEFGAPPADAGPTACDVTRTFEPAAGTLLLFPSQFYHRTLPGHRDGQRISIAFDAIPANPDAALAPQVQQVLARAQQALSAGQAGAAGQLLDAPGINAQLPQVNVMRGRIAIAQND